MLIQPILVLLVQTAFSSTSPTSDIATRKSDSNVAQEPWSSKYGSQDDLEYTGPLSFMHMEYERCLDSNPLNIDTRFDIAVFGMPFDTKTSFRPGARFGPFAIRVGSRRLSDYAYDFNYGASPRGLGAKILDCGDVPVSPFDPAKALDQMETAYTTLLQRSVRNGTGVNSDYKDRTGGLAKDGHSHPRIVTLGGDHTIVLPILRSLNKVYGPVSVGNILNRPSGLADTSVNIGNSL